MSNDWPFARLWKSFIRTYFWLIYISNKWPNKILKIFRCLLWGFCANFFYSLLNNDRENFQIDGWWSVTGCRRSVNLPPFNFSGSTSNPFPFLDIDHHNHTDQMYKPYQCNDRNYLKKLNRSPFELCYQFYFKFYFKAWSLTFAATPFVIFWPMIIAFGRLSMEFVFEGCCYLFRFMANSSILSIRLNLICSWLKKSSSWAVENGILFNLDHIITIICLRGIESTNVVSFIT